MDPGTIHRSVLLDEVISYLNPQDGGVFVDGNLGLGGHTEKILELSGPSGKVIAFEWDRSAMKLAQQRLACFGDRVIYVPDNFTALPETIARLGVKSIDGLILDLGLSSYQLDESERGFSFKGSQSLDMRMDTSRSLTAAELVNKASEEDLADIFFHYGEERQARRIASFIVERRKSQKVEFTDQLVAIIEQAVPRKFRPKKIHVATKVFQALRIAVNVELDNLAATLKQGPNVLKTGAKFIVISFHSLEDRLVKRAFQAHPALKVITKKPVLPCEEEIKLNPRARSAKLRVAEKIRLDAGKMEET